ncbi:MAG: glycosyltransferase family 4 protein, partial [Candidatus Paceibacterota bacterium]
MHILFIASFYPNRVRKIVGVFIQNYAFSLSKIFKVTVLNIEKDKNINMPIEISKERRESINVFIIYYNPEAIKFSFIKKLLIYFYLLKAIFKTLSLIDKEFGKVDKVHLNVSHPLGIIALYLKFFRGIKYYISEQSTLFVLDHFKKHSFFGRLLIKLTYKYASGLSVITDFLGQCIFQLGLYKKPYHIIPNIVSTEIFNIENIQSLNDKPILIHVSTLRPTKGVDMLIDACNILTELGVNYKFIIVGGTGDYLKHIQEKVEKLKLIDYIEIIGELNSREIAVLLKKSDIFLLNSEFETFCVVMIEALAYGLPVI